MYKYSDAEFGIQTNLCSLWLTIMTKKQLGRLMVYAFIDLMIGKGQIVQEDHNGTKTDLRAKIKGNHMRQVVF